MLTALVALSILTLCLVLWKSAPMAAPGASAAPAPAPPASDASLAAHGTGLSEHGKQLQESVSGGKKCPHCGKPI
jgi:hypothetical protein